MEPPLSLNYKDVPHEITPSTPGLWGRQPAQGRKPRAAQSHSPALLKAAPMALHTAHRKSLFTCKGTTFPKQEEKNQYCVQQSEKSHKTELGICFHYQKLNEYKVISWLGREMHSPSCHDGEWIFTTLRKLKFFTSMPCYHKISVKRIPRKPKQPWLPRT